MMREKKKLLEREKTYLKRKIIALENDVRVLRQKVISHNVKLLQQDVDFRLLKRQMKKLDVVGKKEEIEYSHDGGPIKNVLTIERLSFKGGFYRFVVAVNDPTDYERFMEIIKNSVKEVE